MARPRAERHDQQRALIRDLAARAFSRLGYASASMADLAQACQISKAALYHYFENKEAILFEALDDYTLRLQALVRQEVAGPVHSMGTTQSRAALVAVIHRLLHMYADSHSYHVSLLNDVKFLAEAQRETIRAQEREVVDLITALIERAFPGRIERRHRSATTMSLLGMINFTFAWWDPAGPLDADGLADLVVDLWFRGLEPAVNADDTRSGAPAWSSLELRAPG